MAEPTLGLVMILKNEADNLAQSLEPIAGHFDDVVVIDSGSTDGTGQICARLGARVFDYVWEDDFSAARNLSIARSRSDWLFWLDGDNAITPGHVRLLRKAIAGAKGPTVLWAREKVEPTGGVLWQKRCFPRRGEVRFVGRVHEQLVHPAQWRVIPTKVVVRHWGYADPQKVASKGRYYLSLLHRTLDENPRDFYAHFQAARCLLNLRENLQALEHLQAVIALGEAEGLNPDIWSHAHFLFAQAWERLGKPQAAWAALTGLVKAQPESRLAHYHLGRLAYSQGQWEIAAESLGKYGQLEGGPSLIEVDEQKTAFFSAYFQGKALDRLNRYRSALGAFQKALELEPDNLAALNDLAMILIKLERRKEARGILQRVLALRPKDRRATALSQRLEAA